MASESLSGECKLENEAHEELNAGNVSHDQSDGGSNELIGEKEGHEEYDAKKVVNKFLHCNSFDLSEIKNNRTLVECKQMRFMLRSARYGKHMQFLKKVFDLSDSGFNTTLKKIEEVGMNEILVVDVFTSRLKTVTHEFNEVKRMEHLSYLPDYMMEVVFFLFKSELDLWKESEVSLTKDKSDVGILIANIKIVIAKFQQFFREYIGVMLSLLKYSEDPPQICPVENFLIQVQMLKKENGKIRYKQVATNLNKLYESAVKSIEECFFQLNSYKDCCQLILNAVLEEKEFRRKSSSQ